MIRQEAIKKLKDILEEATETDNSVCYVTSDDADALKMAINSLEIDERYELEYEQIDQKADVLDKIRADINRQYKWLINTRYTIRDVDIAFDSIFRTIDKYKAESEDKG